MCLRGDKREPGRMREGEGEKDEIRQSLLISVY